MSPHHGRSPSVSVPVQGRPSLGAGGIGGRRGGVDEALPWPALPPGCPLMAELQ